ncbi:MAG TPA: type II secretion system protein [Chthoniobacteraceae bacterium]|nr:type II secretion system protein [Chthoniobacteraceae bacterium]
MIPGVWPRLLPTGERGFSLTELLVVASLVLALAMIATPAFSRFTRVRDQVGCLSNLRQIGVATLNYANEHGGRLPGPMPATQRASYTSHQITKAPNSLLQYIAPYLGLTPPPSRQMAAVFQCPAQIKLRRGEDDPVFYLHRDTVFADGTRQRPFGYKASNATPSEPMKLQNVIRPGETVAIFDTSGTAAHPEVHVDARNVLFIDGHAERMKLERLLFDGSTITIR